MEVHTCKTCRFENPCPVRQDDHSVSWCSDWEEKGTDSDWQETLVEALERVFLLPKKEVPVTRLVGNRVTGSSEPYRRRQAENYDAWRDQE